MNCFDLGRCDEMPVLQQGIGVVALHSFCCFPEDAELGFGPIKAGLCGFGNSAFAGRPIDDYRREHKISFIKNGTPIPIWHNSFSQI